MNERIASCEAEVARKEGEKQAMERQVAEVQEEVKTVIGRLRTLKQEKDHSQAECERHKELVGAYEEQLKRKEATIKDQQYHLLALSEKIT
jgi:peptidoglycan hydrolase CwlO-like protein